MPPRGETSELRARLEEERSDLLRQLQDLGLGGETEYDPNFADTSQVTAERGEAETLANTLREGLLDIESAIAKLESSTYGRCESCENEISDARLEAKPSARLCIHCAAKP